MIHRLSIERFRGIRELTLRDLGRVNLIVGENNSGKSTVLEAIDLTLSGDPRTLRRREPRAANLRPSDNRDRMIKDAFYRLEDDPVEINLDVAFREGSHGRLQAIMTVQENRYATAELNDEGEVDGDLTVFEPVLEAVVRLRAELNAESSELTVTMAVDPQGSPTGGLRRSGLEGFPQPPPHTLVGTDRIALSTLANRISAFYRSGRKEMLEALLRRIEPELSELAILSDETNRLRPPVVEVKMSRLPHPLRLAAMGEGFTSVIAIMSALESVPTGICLVDEIENGIHHSAQAGLWRAVRTVIERTDAQLWATTHSYECVRAAYEAFKDAPDFLRVHRLERRPDGSHRTRTMDDETLPIIFRDEAEIR